MSQNQQDNKNEHPMESEEAARLRIQQVQSLKQQSQTGGLEFRAYLPPRLAEWVLDMVGKGIFVDPSEAVFVFMGQAKDIEPHEDIKREILRRRLEQAENRKTYTSEEVKEYLEERAKYRTDPAIWNKIS